VVAPALARHRVARLVGSFPLVHSWSELPQSGQLDKVLRRSPRVCTQAPTQSAAHPRAKEVI